MTELCPLVLAYHAADWGMAELCPLVLHDSPQMKMFRELIGFGVDEAALSCTGDAELLPEF